MSVHPGGKGHKFQSMDFETCQESARFLLNKTKYRPKIGVICGTGLANLGSLVEMADVIEYKSIPNFPVSTVSEHKSRCLFGLLAGVEVFVMQGRFHLYEGYDIGQCSMPIRVMKLLGIETVVLSNAAGGLNPKFRVGDVMLLKDHINLPGLSGNTPLAGPEDKRFGPRFFAMNNAYTPRWRKVFRQVAAELGLASMVHEGVYTIVGGPNFETPAELRMLQVCGTDAVGMSTVHEAMTARQCGMSVLAFSLITNVCIMDENSMEEANVSEVIETADQREAVLKQLLSALIVAMAEVIKLDESDDSTDASA